MVFLNHSTKVDVLVLVYSAENSDRDLNMQTGIMSIIAALCYLNPSSVFPIIFSAFPLVVILLSHFFGVHLCKWVRVYKIYNWVYPTFTFTMPHILTYSSKFCFYVRLICVLLDRIFSCCLSPIFFATPSLVASLVSNILVALARVSKFGYIIYT